MKKGDKVRFLSEVGGGKVAGFQGKNIVLVEDEDGFEIPMPINEVVVVEQDDYAMGKMISAKMDAKQKAEEHANTELHQDSRSIKAILNETKPIRTWRNMMPPIERLPSSSRCRSAQVAISSALISHSCLSTSRT